MKKLFQYKTLSAKIFVFLISLFLIKNGALRAADTLFFHVDYNYTWHQPENIQNTDFDSSGMHMVSLTLDLIPLGNRLYNEGVFRFPALFPKVTFMANPIFVWESGLKYLGTSQKQIVLTEPQIPYITYLGVEVPLVYLNLFNISKIGAKFFYDLTRVNNPVTTQEDKTYYHLPGNSDSYAAGDLINSSYRSNQVTLLLHLDLGYLSAGAG